MVPVPFSTVTPDIMLGDVVDEAESVLAVTAPDADRDSTDTEPDIVTEEPDMAPNVQLAVNVC